MKEKIVTHASHAKLQYYRHHYCLVCMTGLLGCRWHRYQQSTRDSRKRDLGYYCLMVAGFLYMLLFFYFWLVATNDIYFITVDMFLRMGDYVPWHELGLGFSSAMLAYFSVIMVLCLLHVQHGHQLYIHPFHLLVTFLTLVSCIVVTVLIRIYWTHLWPLVYISLEVYSPFLQLAAVILMTPLSWLIFRQWFRLSSSVLKILWLLAYVAVMLALYLSPMGIDSPLIRSHTPDRPGLVAVGGAADVAPENTMFAFQKAMKLGVNKIYTTVQISYDGVPFLFNDHTLTRTTNAEEILASNSSMDPLYYTMAELQTLNAGKWFVDNDPWDTMHDMSAAERNQTMSAKIPTLSQLLDLCENYPEFQVYLKVRRLPAWHPYCCNVQQIIHNVTAAKSKCNSSNVFIPQWLDSNTTSPHMFQSMESLQGAADADAAVDTVYLSVDTSLAANIRKHQGHNLSTIASGVNTHWFMSFVWCVGTDLVATEYIKYLQDLEDPIYQLNDASYLALWITIDVLSAVIIVVIFIIHRIRLYGTNFSPESISLNTGRSKTSYRSRTMKEQLLREGAIIDSMDDLDARDNDGMENRPAYSLSSGQQAYSLSSLPTPVREREATASTSIMESGLAPPSTITNRYSV